MLEECPESMISMLARLCECLVVAKSAVSDSPRDPTMTEKYVDENEQVFSRLQRAELPPPQTLGGPTENSRQEWLRRYLPNAYWSDLSGVPPQYQIGILISRFNGHLQYDLVDWKALAPSRGRRGQNVVDRLFATFETNATDIIKNTESGVSAKTMFYDYVKRLAKDAFEDEPEADKDAQADFEWRLLEIARNVIWGSYRGTASDDLHGDKRPAGIGDERLRDAENTAPSADTGVLFIADPKLSAEEIVDAFYEAQQ